MYTLLVIFFMVILPFGSIVTEAGIFDAPLSIALAGKWFVFWAVGMRLLLAGVRQVAQPQFTAHTILGLKGEESFLLVRELGFANIAIGVTAACGLFFPGFILPAAVAGAIFYGLAVVNHAIQKHRNRQEQVAMLSDAWAAVVLAGFLVLAA